VVCLFSPGLTDEQRKIFNAISDVIANRPLPLRQFDQIYMKTADMLMQVSYVSEFFNGKDCVFIGDGDAIGLCLIHLQNEGLIVHGPKSILVLDFDERIVDSVNQFAKDHMFHERATAYLYNVIDPLPEVYWQKFTAFYTNPPFGASNKGKSVQLFAKRGIEATSNGSIGCLVLADDVKNWTQEILFNTQQFLLKKGFVISALEPRFHQYHLDDDPNLHSCTMITKRILESTSEYTSKKADKKSLKNFYGKGKEINDKVKYIKSVSTIGVLGDYSVEGIEDGEFTKTNVKRHS